MEAPENVQKRETVLYGPDGQPLVVKEPRAVGFRTPEVQSRPRGLGGDDSIEGAGRPPERGE